MKLRKLHIEDYKMFKDFDIDFLDSDGEPLPIVVLAGVNGSGKTTLLEFIKDLYNSAKITSMEKDYVEFEFYSNTSKLEIGKINEPLIIHESFIKLEQQNKKYPNNIVLYLYFKDYKDKVILIDQPELSLHPSWQNKVLKIYENFAKQNSCQIIIATHSPHIIASVNNKSIRFLAKDEKGIL